MSTISSSGGPKIDPFGAVAGAGGSARSDVRDQAWAVLKALGSLKLAVSLFAVSLVLVLVGTLAQDELNMLAVKNRYFTTWFAWLYVDDFFPQAFYQHDEPFRLRLPFLGGKTVGVLLFINLIAAKVTRFKVSARGGELTAGLGMLAVGTALTVLIVLAGHNGEGLQGDPPSWLGYSNLWALTLLSGAAAAASLLVTGWRHANPLARKFSIASGAIVGFFVLQGLFGGQISDSGLRIVWQLAKGLGAGLFLLAGCMLVFGRQGGNMLLHIGVALLMFGQFVFGDRQLEQRLSLVEGQSSNTMINLDQIELAFIRDVGETEQITAVPASRLQNNVGKTISDDALPVDVRVDAYYPHSRLAAVTGDNLADTGIGLRTMAVEQPTNGGTDGASNIPSAYVSLFDKETKSPVGRYLVSQWNSDRMALMPTQASNEYDTIRMGDEQYRLGLNFHREVKPYWVSLEDVRRITYSGTETPRDFSSYVRIVDPETGADRKERIWMNNPLRYRGETFYQSSYQSLPGGKELTGIQVVKNSGWLIPYVACSITALGMFAHFLGTLGRFVARRSRETRIVDDKYTAGDVDVDLDRMSTIGRNEKAKPAPMAGLLRRNWPMILSGASAGLLAAMVLVPWTAVQNTMRPGNRLQQFDWYTAGKIPVQSGGRLMPLDAYARQTLKSISNRESLKIDDDTPAAIRSRAGDAKKVSALQWLMEVASEDPAIEGLRMVRIDAEEVRSELGLERRQSKLYSLGEIRSDMIKLSDTLDAIRKKDPKSRDFKERKLVELDSRVRNYTLAAAAFGTPTPRPIPMSQFKRLMPNATESDRQIFALQQLQRRLDALSRMTPPAIVAPPRDVAAEAASDPEINDPTWSAFAIAFFDHYRNMATRGAGGEAIEPPPGMQTFADMVSAFSDESSDPSAFNRAVDDHLVAVTDYEIPGYRPELVSLERWMQTASPSYSAIYIYLIGLVMGLVYLMVGWPRLRMSVTTVLVIAFLVHTLAIYCRMRVTGRAPVINLYSSAVFIGWAAVLFGLSVEGIFKVGIGNLLAAFAGVASLLVAYGITYTTGDTMPVLQAVLDTQFWLATHVISVTLGYVATMVAGFLGMGYLVTRWVSDVRGPDETGRARYGDAMRTLYRCIYGAACFGILFSFVGTVLGGLWADDSWGRFWGWDPKENGALLIVIWNAILLHARWDGMVGPRGFASLAIGGNIVTAWSWFGTNELGIGLHSYGFTEGVLYWLSIFVVSQLAVMAIDGVMRWVPSGNSTLVRGG